MEDDSEAVEFAGAVGFFDAPSVATTDRRLHRQGSFGGAATMGFFEFLDESTQKTLGLTHAAYVHNGDKDTKKLDVPELEALLLNNVALNKLVLRASGLRAVNVQLLSTALMGLHHLQVLDLSKNPLGNEGFQALMDACRGNVAMRELNLSCVGLADAAPELVCQALDDFPSLRLLDVCDNSLAPVVVRALAVSASTHATLEELQLQGNNIAASLVDEVLRILEANTALQRLGLNAVNKRASGTMRAMGSIGRKAGSAAAGGGGGGIFKRSFRAAVSSSSIGSGSGAKSALLDALGHNLSLTAVVLEDVHFNDKAQTLLMQNEQVWEARRGETERVALSGRGLRHLPQLVLTLRHLVELDLSANALEYVSEGVCLLVHLRKLNLDRNDIHTVALPVHLIRLRKLSSLTVSGNPFLADLPPAVSSTSTNQLLGYFRQCCNISDMECQVAAVVCSPDADTASRLVHDLEKASAPARKQQRAVRFARSPLRPTRSLVSPKPKGSAAAYAVKRIANPLLARSGTLRNDASTPTAAAVAAAAAASSSSSSFSSPTASAPQPTPGRGGGGGSFSPPSLSPRGSPSVADDEADAVAADYSGVATLWGALRDCSLALLSVYALFHPVVVLVVDSAATPMWEVLVHDSLSNVPRSARVLLVLVSPNLPPDVSSDLAAATLARTSSSGVTHVHLTAGLGSAAELAAVAEALSGMFRHVLDSYAVTVPLYSRSYTYSFLSMGVPPTAAPMQPLDRFDEPHVQRALAWAQLTGIASVPLVGDTVCVDLEWAVNCAVRFSNFDQSVLAHHDLARVFPQDVLQAPGRQAALRLLESAGVVVHMGWQRDQWLVYQLASVVPPSANAVRTMALCMSAKFKEGSKLCTRLYHVTSAVDRTTESSVVRKVCLQAAGVMTRVIAITEGAFAGVVKVKDTQYSVLVRSERQRGFLTFCVIAQTDSGGQVVHMVTASVERALSELKMPFSRSFTGPEGADLDVDRVASPLIEADTRPALDAVVQSSAERLNNLLPDLQLLVRHRLFWNELKVERTIGQGAFGEISLATVEATGCKVAVKRIKAASVQDSSGQRELLRELWVLSMLRHPNVVASVGVCFSPAAICMEYLDLGDLRAFLDTKASLPWAHTLSLLQQIASGMSYAHSLQPPLVHGDLKSPNILLGTRRGALTAKIADLGVASFTTLSTVSGVDNPLWAAPEMLTDDPLFSPAVDVYSFAIIMWELCSGSFPFAAELQACNNDLDRIAERVANGARPELTQVDAAVPGDALELVKLCWDAVPDKRPPFMHVLARLLELQEPQGPVRDVRAHMRLLLDATVPRAMTCMGDSRVVVLGQDGELVAVDMLNPGELSALRWKLAERVRSASAATLNAHAFFAFGADCLFVLSPAMAARRVPSELQSCDLLCTVDEAVWVGGRGASGGAALQAYKGRTWDGAAWPLEAGSRGQLTLMHSVRNSEVWCVMTERESSVLVVVPAAQRRTARATLTLPDVRVLAMVWVPSSSAVWVSTARSGVIELDVETLQQRAVVVPPDVALRAPLALPDVPLVFAVSVTKGAELLDAATGKAVAAMGAADSNQLELLETATALLVPALPLVVVMTRFALCVWRLESCTPLTELQHQQQRTSAERPATPSPSVTPVRKSADRLPTPPASVPKGKHASVKSPRTRQGSAEGPILPPTVRRRGGSSDVGSPASFRVRSGSNESTGSNSSPRQALHMTRRAAQRATMTIDEQGHIVSANAASLDLFLYRPEELVSQSIRNLFVVPKAKQRTGSVLLFSKQVALPFNESDMWRSIIADLSAVRFVNGQRKDGSHVPVLLSASELLVGGRRFFAIMFERVHTTCSFVVVDDSGVISSASDNLHTVTNWRAEQMIGKLITAMLTSPAPATFMKRRAFDPNVQFDVLLNTGGGGGGGVGAPLVLQVLDYQSNAYTLLLRPKNKEGAAPQEHERAALNYYSLGRVLGTGMCGEVNEATHKLTGARVAVKRLKKEHFDAAGLVWTDVEVQLMRRLDHPNVVQLLDCVRLRDETILVLEYVNGGELFTHCIENGPLNEDMARRYFCDILNAVSYCHSRGVVHRDLKLENCLLDPQRGVKIIDFGLGNFFTASPLRTSCGSPNYAAPELFLSQRYLGPPVDVWALGVILYAMVSGEFPFEDTQSTIDGYYEWPAGRPKSRALHALLDAIFELNVDFRITVDQIMRHEWLRDPPVPLEIRPPIVAPSAEDVRRFTTMSASDIRADIVCRMEHEFGMPVEMVIKSLKDCEVNHFTALYRLLRAQSSSAEDSRSELLISRTGSRTQLAAQVKEMIRKLERDELVMDMENIRARRTNLTRSRSGRAGSNATSSASAALAAEAAAVAAKTRSSRARSRSGLLLAEANTSRPSVSVGGSVGQWVTDSARMMRAGSDTAKPKRAAKSGRSATSDQRPPSSAAAASSLAASAASAASASAAAARSTTASSADKEPVGGFVVEARLENRVLLCREVKSQAVVAIKKVPRLSDRATLMRVEALAKRLRALGPKRWLTLLRATFHDDNFLYLVFDYCPGGSLANLIRSAPLKEHHVRALAAEVVVAVHELHAAHLALAHLDAHDLLLDAKGHVRLLASRGIVSANGEAVLPSAKASAMLGLTVEGSSSLTVMLESGEMRTIAVKSLCYVQDVLLALQWKLRLPASDVYLLECAPQGNTRRWTRMPASAQPLVVMASDSKCKFRMIKDGRRTPTPRRGVAKTLEWEKLAAAHPATEAQAADWFALGGVLYHLATRKPYHAPLPADWASQVAPDLVDLIMQMVGSVKLGAEWGLREFQLHPFFEGVDWALPAPSPGLEPALDSDADFSFFEGATVVRGMRLNDLDGVPQSKDARPTASSLPDDWDWSKPN